MDNKDLYNKDMGNNLFNNLKDSLCLYNKDMVNKRLIFNNLKIKYIRVNQSKLNWFNKANQFKEYLFNNDFILSILRLLQFFIVL